MKAFDLHRMAFDKVPFDFLGEVALRSLYTFVLVFLFLKMTGRRGVRQMSLFEVLIIRRWDQRREMWRFMMMCRWSRYLSSLLLWRCYTAW